ncbi:MAG: peptidyl-prolyl cis-trans isomerase [Acidobacteria bacterium]|nr:peptidyl-prolyl cis-trans isomerase [Acidobacteriota bacterium]MCG3192366.1 Peptidyl-prolyl cis-trans isomerase B [Thermoanaerobaculia bacterium]MCK6684729.1 peptidyl-prolyl cis-trans isomerase [Thermoanaerobaculia bacterium]
MNSKILGALIGFGVLFAPRAAAESKPPIVEFKTSHGTFRAELYPDKAPITVKNFLKYVEDKFFDGVIFHRVIPNFMIQGGGYDKAMQKKPTRDPIKNEAANGLKNLDGTLAMARTRDPNSAAAQFFINVKDNTALDYRDDSVMGIGYCVFGKVTTGLEVVKKISTVPTGMTAGMNDVPVEPVIIESARLVK